ncbi:MAG: VCBS repeat-containing protein [Gemmatimonadales bacterium]
MAEAGDFDGDGRMDVVAIDERVGIRLYHATAAGGFGPGVRLGDDRAVPYALTVADLDLDGRADIVVGFVLAPSAAFVNRGGGRFERVDFGDASGDVYGFAVGDLDEDGRLDIVAARSGAPSVLYLASP